VAAHHRALSLVAVPPLGLGEDLAGAALFLSLACVAALLYLRQAGGRRGRPVAAPLFCLLLVLVALTAVALWSPGG
jgi:hypothetical protein